MVKHVDHPLDSGMSWVSPGSRKTHWLMLVEYQKTTNFVVIYSITQCDFNELSSCFSILGVHRSSRDLSQSGTILFFWWSFLEDHPGHKMRQSYSPSKEPDCGDTHYYFILV